MNFIPGIVYSIVSDEESRGTALVSRRLETAMCYLGLGLGVVH